MINRHTEKFSMPETAESERLRQTVHAQSIRIAQAPVRPFNSQPQHTPVGKGYCVEYKVLFFIRLRVIMHSDAGLVYRYYSSFPSWLGGSDSRTPLHDPHFCFLGRSVFFYNQQ